MVSIKPTASAKASSWLRPGQLMVLVFCCWALVQAILYFQHGIGTDLEAGKYIYEADYLLAHGKVSTPNFWLYSVQIFILAVTQKLHLGILPVYFFQLLMAWISTRAFFLLLRELFTIRTAVLLSLLLVFNFPFQLFNTLLQTESLFHSFAILFACYLFRLKKNGWKQVSAVLLFLLLICFTRPSGLLFVPCAFLFMFFRFYRGYSVGLKIGLTIVLTLAFLFFLNIALGSGGELDLMLPFRDERIICGVPTLPDFVAINTTDEPNSLYGLFYYVTHNPGQFFRMAWLRSQAFFGLTRSYYSTAHNLYLCLYFYPFYIFLLASLPSWLKKNKYILLYCLTYLILTWLTVIMTCDDWHNRFFLTLMPYIYILSAPFIQRIISKKPVNASN